MIPIIIIFASAAIVFPIWLYKNWKRYMEVKDKYAFVRRLSFRQWLWSPFSSEPFFDLVFEIACVVAVGIAIYGVAIVFYDDNIKNEHKNNPCPQCRFEKAEVTYYDKDGVPYPETHLRWYKCPTLK